LGFRISDKIGVKNIRNPKQQRLPSKIRNQKMGPLDKYILRENALKATKCGFELQFQSHWYRSLPLSSIDFSLKINGLLINNQAISITVNGNTYIYSTMSELDFEWLFILEKATLCIPFSKPPKVGEEYEIEFNLNLYIPYILVGPESKPLMAGTLVKKTLICQ
jgi:hypothetical protein